MISALESKMRVSYESCVTRAHSTAWAWPAAATLAAAVFAAACSDLTPRAVDGPPEMDHSRFHPVSVAGEVLYEGDGLALPTRVAIVGDHLVLIDPAADSTVVVLRRSEGAIVRTFGRRGGGPGEYEGVWSIDPVPGSSSQFWIYDLALRRLTHVDLARDFEDGARPGMRSINLVADATIVDPIWIDTMIVSLGFFTEGRLGIFDAHGHFRRTVGDLPAIPGDGVPPTVIQHAYQSTLRSHPDRTLLAVASRHADRVVIYGLDGSVVAAPKPPFGFDPVFRVEVTRGNPVMATGPDLRFGYIDLATTASRIYALFSGRTRAGFPGEASYGEYVHVYDWSGGLVSVLKLDGAALALAVDPADETLYAVRHYPSPAVIRYALPRIADGA